MSFTRSNASRSLFPNDKGFNAQEKIITQQTLGNSVTRKRDMRKKGGKV